MGEREADNRRVPDYDNLDKLAIGGVQYARDKLEAFDLIEKHDTLWRIVDPVFEAWLFKYTQRMIEESDLDLSIPRGEDAAEPLESERRLQKKNLF